MTERFRQWADRVRSRGTAGLEVSEPRPSAEALAKAGKRMGRTDGGRLPAEATAQAGWTENRKQKTLWAVAIITNKSTVGETS